MPGMKTLQTSNSIFKHCNVKTSYLMNAYSGQHTIFQVYCSKYLATLSSMNYLEKSDVLRISTAMYFVVANVKTTGENNSLFCMVISCISPSVVMHPWSVNLI